MKRRKKKWGWGHSGYYKRFWCDSSWELAFLLYHLDHNIPIRRNGRGFIYTYYCKKHKFYPDFIVNGEYIEIKGRMDRKSKAKIRQFPHDLKVVGPKEIQKYLRYAEKEYGEDFRRLLRRAKARSQSKAP